jgi:hypothetical protein
MAAMSDEDIHQPNDKLIFAAFRVPANTAGLLQAKLPPPVAAAMTLAQRYHQEGLQKGRQEDVLEALSIRFEQVPEGLREAVLGVADEGKLRELLRAAIRCQSLEEFARAL